MIEFLAVLVAAFVFDLLAGDPVYPLHPTRLIGKTIIFFEKMFERWGGFNFFGGILIVIFVLCTTLFAYVVIRLSLSLINNYFAIAFDIFILYSAIAFKDMVDHADRVYNALIENNLKKAQNTVQMVVGRNAAKLDKTGIAKATIESLSENFVDGFLSIVFWYAVGGSFGYFLYNKPLLFGVIFALGFRVINTMDSMVGYKNSRYVYFGKFAARLDDIINFIPARLAVLLVCFSAFLSQKDVKGCIKTALQDRLKHSSPNSAHTESAISGALNIKLGGKIIYPHVTVDKPYIGKDYADPEIDDIKRAVKLLTYAAVLCIVLLSLWGLACYYKN